MSDNDELAENYKAIWLGPRCQVDERTWCEDPQPCDECGLPAIKYVRADLVAALSPPEPTEVRRLVDEQARDEGLWFQAQTCAEAYVQTALRKLHAAVEGDKSVIFPARPMPLQDHAEFRFTLQPMDTAPRSIAQARDLYVHEGSFAVVYGTNAKAIGWIDTHALFKDRVYRHHLRSMVAEDGTK